MAVTGINWIRAFKVPPVQRAGETWRYGLGLPLQISGDRVALMLNLRRDGMPYVDFEAGADVAILSELGGEPVETLELSRNHSEPDPVSGEDREVVKYPADGGFVPAGARLPDGTPHPHAGTGFGIIHAIGFPLPHTDPAKRLRLTGKRLEFAELQQYASGGGGIKITGTKRFQPGALPAGVSHAGTSFTAAVPDGPDLLFCMQDQSGISGVARWMRGEDGWLPTGFSRVDGADNSIEPSLVRDTDGSLLFCARGESEDSIHSIRVWRSADGEEWERTINAERTIGRGPVTVNRAADGTPYVVANPLLEGQEPFAWGERGVLQIWPLNPARDGLLEPIVVCDGEREFGESPSGEGWYIDHPNGQTVRLGGEWRHILVYRVADRGEVKDGTDPVDVTGCHVSEVISGGETKVPWTL